MMDGNEYCPYCHKFTWIKVKDFKRESIAGLQVDTSIKEGRCKLCGRLIYIAEASAIEEEKQ